ncbi:hypothetical protein FOA43_002736 [Brettanomyces nanus]|uniref:L-2-hydroxyglutarate dehydrogenase, mitochondrial n=1 Tax=Eeniella nana TaxID=13502 RepID=A0A875S5T4_EENNA|nr:uncharacterized protein FOA43_002736 [Brettanomyces nanus]QPG75382.1 hypothetical protein FOA43_002736 [Brettanomyces nanus]
MSRELTTASGVDFSHTIIGAGVVGLAIGAEIVTRFPESKVLIIEKNDAYGQETSSRNSEVIHAGIYYPEDSLKMRLCLEGKRMIYELKDRIPVKQCGKWILAQNERDLEYLEKLHEKSKRIAAPTHFLSIKKAALEEPAVYARAGILCSPTTGITSAHELMSYLMAKFQEAEGSLALGTKVTGIKYNDADKVYEIETVEQEVDQDTEGNAEPFTISTATLINCAGLHAPQISNMILPKERHVTAYFAKGNYFTYAGKPLHIKRLVYPCPTPGVASLGTHLTIDLGGQIRFGPDLEWVNSCEDYHVSEGNLAKACTQVVRYLPGMKAENLHGSYCGIRPKIIGPQTKRFQDFIIREERGYPGFVNLLGIESPGLTASMGIAKYVMQRYL